MNNSPTESSVTQQDVREPLDANPTAGFPKVGIAGYPICESSLPHIDKVPSTSSAPLDIAGIRARCEAATPGPWKIDPSLNGDPRDDAESSVMADGWYLFAVHSDTPRPVADGEFCARARTDLPAALDKIEELESQLASKSAPSPDTAGITELASELRIAAFRWGAACDLLGDNAVASNSRLETAESALLSAVSKIIEERDGLALSWDELASTLGDCERAHAELESQLASSVERLKEMEANFGAERAMLTIWRQTYEPGIYGVLPRTIPGTVAKHAIVTDTCRANRGEDGAAREAADRLIAEYLQCAPNWKAKGAQFHFVLTLERNP